jgi:AraC-like DNA-binding protein
MIRIIFLLAPVFVSLFWAVTLMGDKKKYSAPRLFLAKYMILSAIIFTSHFLYFAPLPNIYIYFDIPLQFIGICAFPLYHVYFRLLTVDEKFTLKAHGKYLLIPIAIAMIYSIGVLFAPADEYKAWLFNKTVDVTSGAIRFLGIMRSVLHIVFAGTIVLSLAGNYWLITKYGHKAEQFYSDIRDAKQKNAKMLIYSILAMGLLSLVFRLIGREFLLPKDFFIYSGWSMFTVMLYLMGNSGLQQKTLNPYFEPAGITKKEYLPLKTTVKEWEKLQAQILEEFAVNKIYLNSDLNIVDIVKKVGTNRTYLSAFINQQYNQNFCSFVNDYRIKELQKVMLENPECTSQYLADHCGFGSVNSMKRAVYARSAISLSELKNQAYSSE